MQDNLYFMGIDIGSRTSKGVITRHGKLLAWHIIFSGTNYRTAAAKLQEELLAKTGLTPGNITRAVSTGQGAGSVNGAAAQISDLRCCARGINGILPSARTVIDIQAQSSQVIRINSEGQVINFVASEKCATGSGRFLEVIANVLQVKLEDISALSLKSRNPVTFTTSCAVFGESEAISRVAEGAAREDILAGVHQALATKISGLVSRVGLEKAGVVSGGGALDAALVKHLEQRLGVDLLVPPQPQIVNALGAAIMAEESQDLAAESKPLTVETLGGEL